MTANDFLYEYGGRIEKLLAILEEEQNTVLRYHCFNRTDMQIHMFLVSAKLLEEEQVCIFGDLLLRKQEKMKETAEAGSGKNTETARKEILLKDSKLFELLKHEVVELEDPAMNNAIFIEQAEGGERNIFYFMNYMNNQLKNLKFLSEFWNFCDRCEVLHESKKEEHMAI